MTARASIAPMLSIIGHDFDLSGTETGFIASAYFLPYVALQLPTGLLGDRIGLKRALLIMFLIAGLGLVLIGAFATTYLTLILCVAVLGFGAGGFYSPSYGLTFATVPSALRGISSGILSAGMAIGLALGLTIAAPLYLLSSSWRLPFALLSVPTIIMVVVFAFVVPDVRTLVKGPRPSFRDVVLDRDMALLTVGEFCSLWGHWVVINWGPTYFATERGIGLASAGMFTAIAALTALPAGLVMGSLSDRLGRRRITLVMLPIAALMVVALGFVDSVPLLIALLIVYGLVSTNAWHPVLAAWAGDHISVRRPQAMGAAIGLLNALAVSSAIFSPPVSGWLKDVTGSLGSAFYLGGALILCGAVACFFVEETVRRRA